MNGSHLSPRRQRIGIWKNGIASYTNICKVRFHRCWCGLLINKVQPHVQQEPVCLFYQRALQEPLGAGSAKEKPLPLPDAYSRNMRKAGKNSQG